MLKALCVSLKPYDWEARRSASEVAELMRKLSLNSKTEDSSGEDAEDNRIGNTDRCRCGCCRPMDTYTENLCCAEKNEVFFFLQINSSFHVQGLIQADFDSAVRFWVRENRRPKTSKSIHIRKTCDH